MIIVNYKITEVRDRVFAVTIDDAYERAMTFLRVQEYYESPNPKFRGKNFNIWDFIEWYSREHKGAFTYAYDWGGFNIPLPIAVECYRGKDKPKKSDGFVNGVSNMPDSWKSKWDTVMRDITSEVHKMNKRDMNAYIIGAKDMEGSTFQHEVAHGLYYTNKEYKELMDEITLTIPTEYYLKFRKNLLDMGYTESVIDDEIQAYLSWGWDYAKFSKGVPKKFCKGINKEYQKVFNRYL